MDVRDPSFGTHNHHILREALTFVCLMCFFKSGFSILSRLRSTERPRLTSCWLSYVCLIMCPVVLRVARSWVCQFPWSHRFRWSVHLWTAEMISPSWFCGHFSRFLDNNLLFVEFVVSSFHWLSSCSRHLASLHLSARMPLLVPSWRVAALNCVNVLWFNYHLSTWVSEL